MESVYEKIVGPLLQPERCTYSVNDLPIALGTKPPGLPVTRKDFVVSLPSGILLPASSYLLEDSENTILYLHTHSGMRVEGVEICREAVFRGQSIVLFDFRGNGQSNGEYVSFGWNETLDLEAVLYVYLGVAPLEKGIWPDELCALGKINGSSHLCFLLVAEVQEKPPRKVQ